jgi:cobalt-zinc-cadmium efflux system protein
MTNTCQKKRASLQKRFIGALILNGALAIAELIMSIITGSTALLADALNNIDDFGALLFSIYSEHISKKPPDERHTFGHERMDVIAGLAKGCLLLLSAIFILYQSVLFIVSPSTIHGMLVLITATIALAVNLISALWLKQDACHSLNAKGTYLCMIYDAVGSFAVMISGALLMLFNVGYFDILASLVIVYFMVRSGWSLIKECMSIFMQTAPADFDYLAFEKAVGSIQNVTSVGDVHVWAQTPNEYHLTAKVCIASQDICSCEQIIQQVESVCKEQFGVSHTTIQLHYNEESIPRFCKT